MQLYPDMGVAAMLRNEWKDCSFGIAALNERGALADEDEVLILAAADPQGFALLTSCVLVACRLPWASVSDTYWQAFECLWLLLKVWIRLGN